MIVRVLRAGTVIALLAVAGCSAVDDGGRDYNPAHQPRYVLPGPDGTSPTEDGPGNGNRPGTPGPGQADPDGPAHEVRGGDGYARQASVFQLVSGSDVVRVQLADLGGDLFAVSTPVDSEVAPAVEVSGNTVVAGLRQTGQAGAALVTVLLANDVRWQVRLSGGAGDQAVDLTGGAAGGDVEFTAGTTRAEVALPDAPGTQKVLLAGGASLLQVHLGGKEPARLAAHDGAGTVIIDGASHSGVAGGTVFAAPGWDDATDRYDIDATSGVSNITVDRG